MESTDHILTALPLERERLAESVDTLRLVHPLPKLPSCDELWRRGFKPTEGKEAGYINWYYNAPKDEHRPNITLVQNRGPGYGIWVNGSLPKIRHGNNATLLTEIEIVETLDDISNYVTDILGVDFDVQNAHTTRIDYAADQLYLNAVASNFIERTGRLYIPHLSLNTELTQPGSVYFTNTLRLLVIYNKSKQMGLTNKEITQVRTEYRLPNTASVEALRKRIGLADRKASTMLSPGVLKIVFDEMFNLLQMSSFDPTADYTLEYFFNRTNGNYSKARRLSSFVESYRFFGPDFYERADITMTKQTYIRELRECQELGF